jgi:hypothetical protein
MPTSNQMIVAQVTRPPLTPARRSTRRVVVFSRTEGDRHKGGSGIHDALGW